jgi:hypothetical protein
MPQLRGALLQGRIVLVAGFIVLLGLCQGDMEGIGDPAFLGSAA